MIMLIATGAGAILMRAVSNGLDAECFRFESLESLAEATEAADRNM